jgi:hypothetical protein
MGREKGLHRLFYSYVAELNRTRLLTGRLGVIRRNLKSIDTGWLRLPATYAGIPARIVSWEEMSMSRTRLLLIVSLLALACGCIDSGVAPKPFAEDDPIGTWYLYRVITVDHSDQTTQTRTYAKDSIMEIFQFSTDTVVYHVSWSDNPQYGTRYANRYRAHDGRLFVMDDQGEYTLAYRRTASDQLILFRDGPHYTDSLFLALYNGPTPPAYFRLPVPPDGYEPDNSPASAQNITIDAAPQPHTLPESDSDWVAFQGVAGTKYQIEVKAVGETRCLAAMYSADAKTRVDWGIAGKFPCIISFDCLTSGTYYVLTRWSLLGDYTIQIKQSS